MAIDRRYSVAEGTAIKAPVRVATTANITLSGLQAIDGVTVVEHDRVLVKHQTAGTENGIYEASSGNWQRTKDFDGSYDIVTGTRVFATAGTVGALVEYYVSTTGTITVGTTSIAFSDYLSTSAVRAEAAADAAEAAAAALGNQVHQYNTFAMAKVANIPAGVKFVRTMSYVLDLPESGLFYRKVASDPGYPEPAAFQSVDGAWWLFDPPGPVCPEAFGCLGDGVTDDAPEMNVLVEAFRLRGGGTIRPRDGSTYLLGSLSANGLSCVVLRSGVNIVGDGFGAIFKLKSGVNTALQFYHIFYSDNIAGVSNVIYSGFTIDLNGTNNTGGLAAALNIALGVSDGDNIVVDKIRCINNPGSTGFHFGRGPAVPPSVENLRITNCRFQNQGDAVNSGCIDHSSIWVTARNAVIAYNVMDDGPVLFGTGVELHGDGVVAFGNSITDYAGGMNISNETGGIPSYQLSCIGNTFKNVKYGVTVWARGTADMIGIIVNDNNIVLDPDTASVGIDASSQVDVGANGINLIIRGNTITAPGLVSSPTSTFAGITLGAFASIDCCGNNIYNTQGPGIWRTGTAKAASIVRIDGNTIMNAGLGTFSGGTYQVGILVESAANTPSILSIQDNNIAGTVRYGIQGGLNVTDGKLLGNTIVGASISKVNWTGTGMTIGDTLASTAPDADFTVVDGIVTRVV